jgi:peptidoglycan-N-acetylglucosamine deacetylase
MRLFRPCIFSDWLYHRAVFRIKTDEKLLYLTFDDGPDPGSTPRLLDILEAFNIRGLFFCDGRAAEKHPYLMDLIVSKGHIIGNHGYFHPDGWRTSLKSYTEDAERAALFTSSVLFRPPFGRLRINQYQKLKKKYKIVFWDIMPYDFDKSFGSERALFVLKKMMRPGSVIVFHDTPQSSANEILGEFVTYAITSGFRFDVIAGDGIRKSRDRAIK